MTYRYVPETEEPEFSERIKLIQEAHKNVGLEYIPDDKDFETLKEIAYLRLKKQNPNNATEELLSVYRERNDDGEEFMIWKVKYRILDRNDRPLEAEVWLGKKPRLDVNVIRDPDSGNTLNKTITRWNMEYTQKWDSKVFDKLLKDYNSKNTKLYLSVTSDDYWQNFGGTSIMVKDREAYRTKSFDELASLDAKSAEVEKTREEARKMTAGRI